jgi:peptide/nickel transport system substrate-binding protein/oligopeptide transport system substrate-binding protein
MQPRKEFVRGFLPTLLCTLAMLLAACGGGSNGGTTSTVTKAPANKQIYIDPFIGVTDIKSFDPAIVNDHFSNDAVDRVFTGLVQLNDKLEVVDQLAASHSIGADGTTYTFKLRPNLKFSDGTPLTSTDVAYSIDRAFDPAVKSPTALSNLTVIVDEDKRANGQIKTLIGDSLLTPDPQTLIIKTTQKAAYFLYELTQSTGRVVEKKLVQKYGSAFTDHLNEGGCTGPWEVSKYIHSKEIDFVPNPYYYGSKPQLKKLIIPFYQSYETSYNAYLANQVDVAAVPIPELQQAKALPEGQYYQHPYLSITYLTMNYLTKPFDNIKIRQAFSLAINRDEITHNIYKDVAIPSYHIFPQGMPGYNPNLTGPAEVTSTGSNAALAKQLFQQGLQDEGLTLATLPPITYTTSSTGSADVRNEDAATQQMWKNVLGVNVTINDIDFNKMLDEMNAATNNPKGIQMWSLGTYATYPDPQDFTPGFYPGNPGNSMNYGQNHSSDAAAQQRNQQLMRLADANMNPTTRMQQYLQAEQQLVNDVALSTLYQQTFGGVRKSCVAGVVLNSQDMVPPDDWANIYITTNPICANTSQYQ